MLARVLIALLAIAGPNPLRICTCMDHDEPLLGAACDSHHPEGCDCPVFQPVAKQTAPPVAAPDASQFAFLLPLDGSTEPANHTSSACSFELAAHATAVPLYVTLRTLRN